MQFSEIKTAFGFSSDVLGDGFEISLASVAEASAFLSEPFIRKTATSLAMSEEITSVFIDALSLFKDERVTALFWHCRGRYAAGEPTSAFGSWEHLPATFHPYAAMFYAFVILSLVPDAFTLNAKRGIPESITRDTLADIEIWVRTNKQRYGACGFRELGWLSNHLRGKIFGLGRLQFIMEPFSFHDIVLKSDDGVAVLAPAGLRYRSDGLYDGVNGVADVNARVTEFREDAEAFHGNYISPDGRLTGETRTYPKTKWHRAVTHGDDALSFHIPASGPMDHAACGVSFARAREFFPKYFPEKKIRAFFSSSWLFDGELERVFNTEANIVKFQREFYLIPQPNATDDQLFERVFLKRYANIDEAPQTSSLQKAIVAHLKSGKHLRSGNALLLIDDSGWDTPYRRR